jgi:hypothetical protein
MLKTFAFAAAFAAITTTSALAQSYSADFGTGNVTAMEPAQIQQRGSVDQGLNARAEAPQTRHHAKAATFTNNEKALFGRIRPY